jgi:hypothetical protein
MPYLRKISDQCLKDLLDEGFNQSEIARTCSITRQAVSIRIHFKPKKSAIALRRWTVSFLWRLGFTILEIVEFTGYAYGTVSKLLIDKNGTSKIPVYWR